MAVEAMSYSSILVNMVMVVVDLVMLLLEVIALTQ